MTAVVVVLSVAVAVLAVLVAGLLRAYADLLRRLHALDGGGQDAAAQVGATAAPPFQVADGVAPAPVRVEGREEWTAAHDVQGTTPAGEVLTMRLVSVEHDTIAVFLSTGCTGCERYWTELQEGWRPSGSRLVVLTKGPEDESPSLVAAIAPRDVEVVMSSQAWADYDVPGSPFVVAVHGPSGRVRGHGSASSLAQVEGLIGLAGGDAPVAGGAGGGVVKSAGDREREADVDAELARSGIGPGHPSLYAPADHDHVHDHVHDHDHEPHEVAR